MNRPKLPLHLQLFGLIAALLFIGISGVTLAAFVIGLTNLIFPHN